MHMTKQLAAAIHERNRLGQAFWDSRSDSAGEKALVYAYNIAHQKCIDLGERHYRIKFIDPQAPGETMQLDVTESDV